MQDYTPFASIAFMAPSISLSPLTGNKQNYVFIITDGIPFLQKSASTEADEGSANSPVVEESIFWADMISASLTVTALPACCLKHLKRVIAVSRYIN